MAVTIKELHTNEEFFAAIDLQKIVWRLTNYQDCIPNHIFMAVAEIGGMVLGAYVQTRMVGFLMAMIGQDGDGIFHHSHILGVHPEFAHKNIGFALKKAHYERAKKSGIRKVTWTYDPLQGANANLNIAKLGSIVRKYKVNYYGEVMGESGLVSGLPSDRFWIEWFIQSRRVKNRMDKIEKSPIDIDAYQQINRVEVDTNGLQKMVEAFQSSSDRVAIEIPLDFQAIFDIDKKLANDWRLKTRDLFVDYFHNNYTVVDFVHLPGKANFYLLEKNFEIE